MKAHELIELGPIVARDEELDLEAMERAGEYLKDVREEILD